MKPSTGPRCAPLMARVAFRARTAGAVPPAPSAESVAQSRASRRTPRHRAGHIAECAAGSLAIPRALRATPQSERLKNLAELASSLSPSSYGAEHTTSRLDKVFDTARVETRGAICSVACARSRRAAVHKVRCVLWSRSERSGRRTPRCDPNRFWELSAVRIRAPISQREPLCCRLFSCVSQRATSLLQPG
jgi:hypothetical protein